MKPFPVDAVWSVGPRCPMCLQRAGDRRYIPRDECDGVCLTGSWAHIGVAPKFGHLHYECDCGFVWAAQTAREAGHDPDRQ